ncbi:agmatine deiminase family protein [endosymbiont of unidentified scaly snail isolate Monju]|uniref:agmatine deiminase family protein n=1 Tax=endosymbiont of unidentified scaly snail isolate Monju TaxID=1248727 RepID=UPI0005BB6FF5|nr:agmatine deiminase family protein [endosymbiont of unidentified scaly snail isolate Monju]
MLLSRLPAEREPQAGVQLTWPHPGTDWADDLPAVEAVFLQIARAITADEPLLCVCRDLDHRQHVQGLLQQAGIAPARLLWSLADSDDTWARDHGPLTTLNDGKPRLHDFRFDGWGGKFAARRDDAITAALHAQGCFADTPLRQHELVLEGGAIETDGRGTLLATRSSVLDPIRNPGLGQSDIEALLREHLGLSRFLWLDHGVLSGDDTDAHIDVLARFTDPHTIVHITAPPGDPDHAALAAMAAQLATFRDAEGRPYRLIPLPFAGEHHDADDRRLPASYANFLVTNRSVLLPVYGVPADAEAARLLAEVIPGRRIVPIDCRPVIRQNGSLHCLTMQYPQALPLCSGEDTR